MRTSQQDVADARSPVEVEVNMDIESRRGEQDRDASSIDPAQTEVCPNQPLAVRVEALLIASDRPLTEGRIAEVLGLAGKGTSKAIVAAIEELNGLYENTARSFRAERLAGGWQILTVANLGPVLNRLHTERQQSRLSQPALETLAIVAYRQPIMRAEIEAIRGVASGEVLRSLMERRLIKIVGRAEELGRPMLYGTTKEFLKVFGLSGMDDLPAVKGLSPQPASHAGPKAPEAAPKLSSPDAASADSSELDA